MGARLSLFCIVLAALSASPGSIAAGPADGRFYRGERLSAEYRRHNYVVDNWRAHRLHAPPRGHYWVEVGADYLLVAIATGIIVDVLTSQGAAAPPAPAPQAAAIFYYFCESANAYYPYVTRCPEGWKTLPTSPPPGPLR